MMRNLLFNKTQKSPLIRSLLSTSRAAIAVLLMVLFGTTMQAQGDFDLALRVFPTESTPVEPGDVASFTIEVHNQGDINAQNIKLVNYIPSGLEFVSSGNGGWSSVGARAITTIGEIVEAGTFVTRTLNLRLRENATPSNIINYTEIALAQDEFGNDLSEDDIDSTPDTDNTNDAGGQPFSDNDDNIDEVDFVDEDDHDVALLIICTQNACNDFVNISLNAACSIEVLADMIVENPAYPNGAYTVVLEDEDGNELPNNMIDGTFVGQTISVTAFIEGCESDACWGYATIEDKFAINLFCQVDTVDCGEDSPEDVGLPLAPGTSYTAVGDEFIVDGNNGCSDVVLSYNDDMEELPCQTGSPYVARIIRTWTAIDGVGNEESCTSEVYIRKGNISDVVAPEDRDADNPLICGMYLTLPNGNPDPASSGFPEGISCPNMIAVYEDVEIPSSLCPGTFDVLREWTVVDWCNSNDTTFTQIIKIMDIEAPSCNAPQEFTGGTYNDQCLGYVNVANPSLTDNCSSVTYTVAYKPYTAFNNDLNDLITEGVSGTVGDYRIDDLAIGRYRIFYFAVDACGNESNCSGTFRVNDTQEPTPVCIISESVTLDAFGTATLNAGIFDAGSFDNCGIDGFKVRRMDNTCGYGTSFKNSVNFCCADAGKIVMVAFQVTDNAGNINQCMVAITVNDDQAPTLLCPSDLTLTCTQYDGYNQEIPLTITGEPFVNDNCDTDVSYFDTKAFNNCGVGIVVRNWTAVDPAGNSVTCKQYIEVESDFQFNTDMIQWPADAAVNQCINDPISTDATGLPILPSESCSSFSISFDDNTIEQNGAGCGVVERTFTVTDNCALDPNNNSFSYIQLIEVFENEDPVFVVCEDITVTANNINCNAPVNYIAEAFDNCTAASDLTYSFTVDYFNDGSIDESKIGNSLNGTYPSGTHRAVFRAKDECNNEGTCAFLFTILDEKNPTPICLPVSVSLDENGEVEIWASDFNHKSYDNCTDEDDLFFTFSENSNDLVRTFDCDDLINGLTGVVEIQMYVWDQAGNYDYCTVTLTITDTDDFCPDSGSLTADLSGKIMTIKDDVDFSQVEISISSTFMDENKMSDNSGNYMFEAVSLYDNYTVRPFKNDDALNGVTTLDIVKIQKHILGIDLLETMESHIAADVNSNASIDGLDIIQLRKLLLGHYPEEAFPSNTSWRFVPGSFQWNTNFPFEIQEEIQLDNLLESKEDLMFYGIKIGDVNGSASVNLMENNSETRTNPANMYVDNQSLIEGEVIEIPIYLEKGMNVEGFQLAFDFDNQSMDVLAVHSPTINVGAENYNILDKTIYVSWDNIGGIEVDDNTVLFTISVKAKKDQLMNEDDLKINTEFKTEIFNNHSEVKGIEFDIRSEEEAPYMATQLINNHPNPFSDFTMVEFDLEKDSNVNIKMYSANGSQIFNSLQTFTKGNHKIEFSKDNFPESGVYYLQIDTNSWSSSIKMIKI